MPYFPAFINLKDKLVVVVGGGNVASRKVKKLLPFGARLKVIAPRVSSYIEKLAREGRIELIKRRVRLSDLSGAYMVIVAVDNLKVQKRLYNYCEKKGIWCNSVDNLEFCNFVFPALVIRGELVIGITTSGRVPALSAVLKEHIENCLPPNVEELLYELERLRKSMPKGRERRARLILKAREIFFKQKGTPTS